jgi:uncharacterized protein
MRTWKLAALATLAAGLALFAAAAEPDSAHGLAAQLRADGLTVTGIGVAQAVPDRAEISFGVISQAQTASQALTANDAAIRRVVAALRTAGIAAADLQTQSFSISPRTTEEGDEIRGYTAQNTVTATLRQLARAGAVIDAAVGAGANQVYGPSLSRSNARELYQTALRAAVADARAKEEVLSAAAGGRIGAVVGIAEGGDTPVSDQGGGRQAAPAAAQIEPGTQEIRAGVVVTFSITA